MIDIISWIVCARYFHDINDENMITNQSFTLRNRKQAGMLLAEKLINFKNSDAIVVGVPYGGAMVGYHLAEKLNLAFDVVGCKIISHPADTRKTIGSISSDQVVIHDEAYDIPRDYIYHQIVCSQNALKEQQAFYHNGKHDVLVVKNAAVILTGDMVKSADALIASVRTLRSQNPKKIILAASLVTPEALRQLSIEVDEIVSLAIEEDVQPGGIYEENSALRDEDIRGLLLRSLPN
jgi:putative phosphoribosyl transferase